MKIKRFLALAFTLAFASGSMAFEWDGIEENNRIGGRMVSPGYLRGKIILFDCRDYASRDSVEAAKALQSIWASYKTKDFILLGCHTGSADKKRVAAILDKIGVKYPVYSRVKLTDRGSPVYPSDIRVIDSTGRRILYGGADFRSVSGVVGGAVFSTKMPSNARQLKYLLDWEIQYLPGRAYTRLQELQKNFKLRSEMMDKFPDAMETYDETMKKFSSDDEIKKLARLVELSRLVKDRDKASKTEKRITRSGLERAAAKYEFLKESKNEYIVQEAKNSLADLKFAEAALKK